MTRPPRARVPSFALKSCAAVLLTFATNAASAQSLSEPVSDEGIVPLYYAGNPTCADLGYAHEFKPQADGGGDFDGGEDEWEFPGDSSNTVHVTSDGTYVAWDSTLGIDAVIVKGGPNANSYVYEPPEESFGDSGLASPINPNTDEPYGLSHVNFCYDYEVEVDKDAQTSFDRDWDWTIEKTGDASDVTLSAGQSYDVCYTVSVAGTSEDSNWSVSGTITIYNPDPTYDAHLQSVSDVVSDDIAADVDCGDAVFPDYTLGSGQTLVCTYSTDLPNGDDRLNTATVEVCDGSKVGGGSGTAAVDFGDPTNETDECISVNDDQYGDLGVVCGDTEFDYCLDVGSDTCGDNEFTNTASFVTNDTGTTGSASWTVNVHIPCDTGCTLTQGYWKTHSTYGPAPYDDTWALVGEDTEFFKSNISWYDQFWIAPAGNAYFILSHQYAAAYLNQLNGASSTPAVTLAMTNAATLFNAQGDGDTTLTAAEKKTANALATTLDNYNNGLKGPGHCDE